MKKKLMGLSALLMSLAISTSAFAAVPRQSGDADGRNGETLTAGDLVKIADSAIKGTNVAEGNFDGYWGNTKNERVTVTDAQALLQYILQPENFKEDAEIRIYSSKYEDVYKVFAGELDSTVQWDGTYANTDATVTASSDATLENVIQSAVNQAASKGERFAETLNKIYFTSDVKGDVYLTTEDGFAMFKYAMRYIVPVDQETLTRVNKTASGDELYNEATTSAEKKARYEAMKELEGYVLAASGGNFDLANAYTAAKKAFPSGLSQEELDKTYDETAKIVKDKYTFSVNGLTVYEPGSSAREGYELLCKLFREYETNTVNTVINEPGAGDVLAFTATNNKTGATTTVVAELYVTGGAK